MIAAVFEYFGRKAVWPGCFVVLESLRATWISWKVGDCSRSGMVGSCGISSMKVGSVGLMQFNSSFKCSAQRDRIPCWSLIITPSLPVVNVVNIIIIIATDTVMLSHLCVYVAVVNDTIFTDKSHIIII